METRESIVFTARITHEFLSMIATRKRQAHHANKE